MKAVASFLRAWGVAVLLAVVFGFVAAKLLTDAVERSEIRAEIANVVAEYQRACWSLSGSIEFDVLDRPFCLLPEPLEGNPDEIERSLAKLVELTERR